MQTIQQPHKVTVSPDDLASPSGARNLVIVVLEHKHALLLWQQRHDDALLHSRARPATANSPTHSRDRPLVAGIPDPTATTEPPEWAGSLIVGISTCSRKVLSSPCASGRLGGCKRAFPRRPRFRIISRAHYRRGESRCCPAWGWHYRAIMNFGPIPVSIKTVGPVANLAPVRLGWWINSVFVTFVNVWSVPGIILVIHRGLWKCGWRPGCCRYGILGRWGYGSLW